MITVNERFEVPAAPQTVWDVLSDPRAVVSCVPGASLGEEREAGEFDARVEVRFGPTRVTFHAKVVLELNAAAMEGRLTARGKDAQGGARLNAKAVFRVSERPGGTGSIVGIEGDVEIGGRLATLIEGGASVVVQRMSAEFARALAARCAEPSSARGEAGGA